jgi:hypothetical protein
MKSDLIGRLLRRIGFDGGMSRAGGSDELMAFARKHLAQDFPNPRRLDCPSSELFSSLIRDRQLPNDELRRHLVTCSECFRDYGESLKEERQIGWIPITTATKRPAPSLVPSRVLTIVFGTFLIMVSAIGLGVWYPGNRDAGADHVAKRDTIPPERSAPSVSTSSPEPTRQAPAKKLERLAVHSEPRVNAQEKLTARNRVEIDLEASSRSRGTSQLTAPATVLSARNNEILIKLPLHSPSGRYRISLTDPFGKSIESSLGWSRDGNVLHARLKLNSVNAGKYLICVSREAEVPDCVPATVVAP